MPWQLLITGVFVRAIRTKNERPISYSLVKYLVRLVPQTFPTQLQGITTHTFNSSQTNTLILKPRAM